MTQGTMEQRLDRLEKLVDKVLERLSGERARKKDWRGTIGMFDNDPIMKDVIEGALRSRQDERARYYEDYDSESDNS